MVTGLVGVKFFFLDYALGFYALTSSFYFFFFPGPGMVQNQCRSNLWYYFLYFSFGLSRQDCIINCHYEHAANIYIPFDGLI